jgi:phosphoglycolate phosphatase
MARAAGVRAIGVAWGYHSPHELRAAGAVAVAESPIELERLLDD